MRGDLARKYPELMGDVEVVLLQSAQSILTQFSAGLQQRALDTFRKTGVSVRTGVRVVAITQDQARLYYRPFSQHLQGLLKTTMVFSTPWHLCPPGGGWHTPLDSPSRGYSTSMFLLPLPPDLHFWAHHCQRISSMHD